MDFIFNVEPPNSTEASIYLKNDLLEVEFFVLPLSMMKLVAKVFGVSISFLGFLFNYFCFITADQLPKASSAVIMKYVAVYDTIMGFYGVLKIGSSLMQQNLDELHVRTKLSFHACNKKY